MSETKEQDSTDRSRALTELPEEIEAAISEYGDAVRDLSEWTSASEVRYRDVRNRADDVRARLVAVITAALARGAEDTARWQFIHDHVVGFGETTMATTAHDMDGFPVETDVVQVMLVDGRVITRETLDDAIDAARDQARAGSEGEQ